MTWRQSVCIALGLLSGLASEDLAAQEPLTKKEQQIVKQLGSDLEKLETAFQKERGEAAVKAYATAIKRIAAIKEPTPGLVSELSDELTKLAEYHKKFTDAGVELPEPPTLAAAGGTVGVSFSKQIAPLLVQKCGGCHVRAGRGNFQMAQFEDLEKTKAVVKNDPVSSRLVQMIDTGEMPKGGGKVSDEELNLIRTWISQGAQNDSQLTGLAQIANAESGNAQPAAPEMEITKPTGTETVSFSKDIAPILVAECSGCHLQSNQPRGNLNLSDFRGLVRGGDSGPLISTKDATNSFLVKKLLGTGGGNRMPAGKGPLSDAKIELIETWINEGAAFDGSEPNTPTTVLAATATALSMDHQGLKAKRATQADANWKKVMSNIPATRLETNDFLLQSTLIPEQLSKYQTMLNEIGSKLRETVGADSNKPLLKGNVVVYVFNRRYDFNEFFTMIEGHPATKASNLDWNANAVDAYVAFLTEKDSDEESEKAKLTQSVAAAVIAGSGQDIPRWFADGIGYSITEKMYPKSAVVKNWQGQSVEAARNIKQVDDLLKGKLANEIAGLAGYQLVKQMASDPQRFRALMSEIKKGTPFDPAVKTVFGADLKEILTK